MSEKKKLKKLKQRKSPLCNLCDDVSFWHEFLEWRWMNYINIYDGVPHDEEEHLREQLFAEFMEWV